MGGNATAGQNQVNLSSTMALVKSYNPANGILTCYVKHYAYTRAANSNSNVTTLTDTQNAPVNVYLVN